MCRIFEKIKIQTISLPLIITSPVILSAIHPQAQRIFGNCFKSVII
jgi:hypothetical protein